MKKRYLTKSRYKLALECPTKLYYTGKKDIFEDISIDDPFLKALASGGFQVGELAKIQHPGGHMIETLDYDQSIKQTNDLLKHDNVIIYEAAFQHSFLFVRVDILVKTGKHIQLIEVKSKSFDPNVDDPFYDKQALKKGKQKIKSKWRPYLEDIAFQMHVVSLAKPEFSFIPFLMMADKSKYATVSGLNQKFLLQENRSGRTFIKVKEGTKVGDLGDPILCKICVSEQVEVIHAREGKTAYSDEISKLANAYANDEKVYPILGSYCKECQFKSTDPAKSGFHHCWREVAKLKDSELAGPFVFDVWNFRKSKKLIENGTYMMKDIAESDVNIKEADKPGISSSERQWKQIELATKNIYEPYIHPGLREEIESWRYPLHFIDFETTMVAIPFNQGRRPYEQIAFQFSHHQVEKNGKITHKGQFLNRKVGEFPNFNFLRALKVELEKDNGTIFRYAAHENNVLCQIFDQLTTSNEPDKEELQDWIRSITTSKSDGRGKWESERSMVDMCELVKSYYYHPLTKGSNSIKKVLPASLIQSNIIKERYSKPIYGSDNGIKSLNFQDWVWVQFDENGNLIDPYKLLPPVFKGIETEKLDLLLGADDLADGGSAMIAYAKMQFTEMAEVERKAISDALLKYCELDTFAMVLLFEHWLEISDLTIGQAA